MSLTFFIEHAYKLFSWSPTQLIASSSLSISSSFWHSSCWGKQDHLLISVCAVPVLYMSASPILR